MTGCLFCGQPGDRRADITSGQFDPKDPDNYQVHQVLRGIVLCMRCITDKTLGQLLEAEAGGIGLVRGCLVQCIGQPPWWLRATFYHSNVPSWRKSQCPSCHGKASVQLVSAAVPDTGPGAWRTAWRDTFAILKIRKPRDTDDDDQGDNGTCPACGHHADIQIEQGEIAS